MSMLIGDATVVVVEREHGAMRCDAFKGKLEAVLQMIDRGDLGGGTCYGCDEHKAALNIVESQLAATRAKIAEMELEDAEQSLRPSAGEVATAGVPSGAQFDAITANSSLDALESLIASLIRNAHHTHLGHNAEVAQNLKVLREMVADGAYTIGHLSRALRAEVEPPMFMGEPVAASPAAGAIAATAGVPSESEVAQLRDALHSIRRYGLDTLSGRVDGPDDRDWQRRAVNEMTKRAYLALEAVAASPAAGAVAAAAGVPSGWKLVPVEPSEAMVQAGRLGWAFGIPHAWSEMLAASPAAGVVQGKDAHI